jgi:hypothetical protein
MEWLDEKKMDGGFMQVDPHTSKNILLKVKLQLQSELPVYKGWNVFSLGSTSLETFFL